jgi:putative peptidoglycan lipid II flippase
VNADGPGGPPPPDAAIEEAAPQEVPQEPPRTGGSAQLVAAGILLSRIAGLVRVRIFAQYFGNSLYASAFNAALRMPNVLQNLLGEGTLSASFIPVYSRLLERGEKEAAGRVAGAIFALLLAFAGGLALFGVVAAPLLVDIFFTGFTGEQRDVTVACVRIIFPMTGILVLSAWTLGILNSHRRFFVPYVAPVLWSAAMIVTLLVFGPGMAQRPLVVTLAWGALVGGALQFGIQLPFMLRVERRLRAGFGLRDPHVRTVLANAGPAILGRGVVQVSGWVDMWLAAWLFVGAVAAIGYAQTLYVLPVSLFGMSVAAAELPEMSRQGASKPELLRARLEAGLRQIAILVVPAVVGYILLGDVVVAALYETGEFGPSDTALVAIILAGYTIGLFASTATRLYSSALYALQDTRTPARIAAVRVVVSAALGVGLMLLLEKFAVRAAPFAFGPAPAMPADLPTTAELAALGPWRPLGAAGLSIAAGIAAWIEWRLLRRAVSRRVGGAGAGRGFLLRLGAAGLIAAAVARAVDWVLPPLDMIPPIARPIATAVVVLGVFGVLYFAAAHMLGVREALNPIRRVTRRFRSR